MGTVEAMEGTVEAMEAMEATEATTTARGPLMLRLRLMLSPPPLPSLDTTAILTDTEPMATTVIMEVTMEVTTEDIMATVATEDTTTARGLLMLSPDTATTVMGTEATVEDTMVMLMVMATDTTVEKFQKFMLIQSDLEFSTNEFGPLWY